MAFHPPFLAWTALGNQITKKNSEHKVHVVVLWALMLDDCHEEAREHVKGREYSYVT